MASTFTPIEPRAAPVRTTGAVAWAKKNLFAGWPSTLATIVMVGLGLWMAWRAGVPLHGGQPACGQSTNSTVTPFEVILASSVASQLVRRMQPWLWVLPILDGSGVPWMP